MMISLRRRSYRVNLKSDEVSLTMYVSMLIMINLKQINQLENTVLCDEIIIFTSAMSNRSI